MTARMREIVDLACFHAGVRPDDIRSRRRGVFSVLRGVLAFELRERWRENGLGVRPSYPEIAAVIGLRSHSAVINAVKKKGGG